MHVPDGFLDLPTSIATGAVAAASVAVALRLSRGEIAADRKVPMIGIVATTVFATQMMNFPVGPGTSGHLLGGVLAAVLLGPATGLLSITAVLIVQALVFADGGITALGTNIVLMGVVPVLAGWAIFRALLAILPDRRWSVGTSAGLAGGLTVPLAAAVFAGLFVIGGEAPVPAGELFAAMTGWHALIGVGEAVITGILVSAVVAVRPDLAYGRRLVRAARPAGRETVAA